MGDNRVSAPNRLCLAAILERTMNRRPLSKKSSKRMLSIISLTAGNPNELSPSWLVAELCAAPQAQSMARWRSWETYWKPQPYWTMTLMMRRRITKTMGHLDTMCARTVMGATPPMNTSFSASTMYSKRFRHLLVVAYKQCLSYFTSQCGEEKMEQEEWMDLAVAAKMQVMLTWNPWGEISRYFEPLVNSIDI